jgi:hypothetical protein
VAEGFRFKVKNFRMSVYKYNVVNDKKVLEKALNKETFEESVNELNKIQDTLERLSGSLGSQITKVVES